MANLLNNQFNNLRLEIDESEYWDFFINKDSHIADIDFSLLGKELVTKCLTSFIDLKDERCIKNNKSLVSMPEYIWENSINNMGILENIGYTGVDNGLIWLKRDEINNKRFLEIYQNSTYELPDGDTLLLNPVDGSTKNYDYPLAIEKDRAKLNGGFYQGFFKTECDQYQILPDKLENGECWDLEFVLEKKEFEKESNKTLNDRYPANKGIFFYLGTRAENKWYLLYEGIEESCGNTLINDYVDTEGIKERNEVFFDMSVENVVKPVEWESEAIDDYLGFKYYDNDLYRTEDHGLEDYFFEKHKAVLIDENEPHDIITCWCKCKNTEVVEKRVKSNSCNCGRESIEYNNVKIIPCNDGYISKGDFFDLVDDLEIFEGDTEYVEPELDISDFEFKTKDGFDLKIKGQWFKDYTNPFLLFDRTCNGYTVHNYEPGDRVRYVGVKHKYKTNPFLLLNRTCTGYTATQLTEEEETIQDEYNVNADLWQNAFALRITDDGRIGYRYLIQDCDSEEEYTIREGYSSEGIVKEDEISVIHIRIRGFVNTMALEFYVNGKLVFLTKEMPKINLRPLKDLYEKQEGVPYNISLGGGTQGLLEVVLPNYMMDLEKVYPLEKNFCGTFIGYLYSFKFYSCCLKFFEILGNYKYETEKRNNYK